MNGDVICLITLNDVLRFVFRCMTLVTFENDFRSDLLLHDARDAACFRIPLHMIATLERLGHFGWFLRGLLKLRKRCQAVRLFHPTFSLLSIAATSFFMPSGVLCSNMPA